MNSRRDEEKEKEKESRRLREEIRWAMNPARAKGNPIALALLDVPFPERPDLTPETPMEVVRAWQREIDIVAELHRLGELIAKEQPGGSE
jgi:hypothetical protein